MRGAIAGILVLLGSAAQGGILDLDESTAMSSSIENASYVPARAFDDNTGTRWSSAHANNQWVLIDLGGDYVDFGTFCISLCQQRSYNAPFAQHGPDRKSFGRLDPD